MSPPSNAIRDRSRANEWWPVTVEHRCKEFFGYVYDMAIVRVGDVTVARIIVRDGVALIVGGDNVYDVNLNVEQEL